MELTQIGGLAGLVPGLCAGNTGLRFLAPVRAGSHRSLR